MTVDEWLLAEFDRLVPRTVQQRFGGESLPVVQYTPVYGTSVSHRQPMFGLKDADPPKATCNCPDAAHSNSRHARLFEGQLAALP